MQSYLCVISVSSGKCCSCLPGVGGGHQHKGDLYPMLGQIEEEQRALSESTFSHLPSAQKMMYTKVAYFSLEYPDPFHKA